MVDTSGKAKRGPGRPSWKKNSSANPGGVVKESNKSIRKTLLLLLEQKPSKEFKPKTKAEEIALMFYETAKALKGSRDGIPALKGLTDRADGKSAPSPEEQEAIKASGTQVLIMTPE